MARQSTVQYRRLNRDEIPHLDPLKQAVVSAMLSQRGGRLVGEFIGNRRFDLDQDGRLTLLNRITERNHWGQPFFSGQLTYFERGANVPAILGDPDADVNELDLGQFALGDNASMIHGILYFVAIGDHVGLIESNGLKSGRLERFLTQILTQSDILQAGQTISLDAQFTADGGRQVAQATEVQVAATRATRPPAAEGVPQVVERDIEQARREGNSVIQVLEVLGWSPQDIESLMQEVPPGGWLEGFFRFFIKSRQTRKRPMQRQVLDHALRNIDPANVTILGRGKRERDGFTKLTSLRAVETVGSLLNPTSAVQQIEAALRDWAASGEIDLAIP